MLDDIEKIKQHDPTGYLSFVATEPAQLEHDFGISGTQFARPVKNIVYAGMGGSALAAGFARTYPFIAVPFVVCKEYELPAFVDEYTLVICSSFSGNTEEALSALAMAEEKDAMLMIIAHGGKLAALAEERGYPLAEVPACPQPRTAAFYIYRALVEILVAAELADTECIKELAALRAPLEQASSEWLPEVLTEHNWAKQLAEQMHNTTPIIYAGPLLSPAAYKWKISINENAKNTAWCNAYPEVNHNEFIGWSSHPVDKPFSIFNLTSQFEHPRVRRRFEVSEQLLAGKRPAGIEVPARGQSPLEHMLFIVLLGDFASTYLGILNGLDPAPVDLVEKLKVELG